MTHTIYAGQRKPLSRRLIQIGAAAVLGMVMLQASPAAQAHENPQDIMNTIETLALGTLESRDGEEKLDFLKRVGRTLHGYTRTTQLEACGIIIERPGQEDGTKGKWVVPLVTQMSHIACAAVITVPKDARMTGETIHSHPILEKSSYAATPADVKYFRALHGAFISEKQRMPHAHKPGFSVTDFAAGPGWLVDGDRLLFQRGKRRVVDHGSIHDDDATRVADTLPVPSLPGVAKGVVRIVDIKDMGVNPQPMENQPVLANVSGPKL